jgi:C4-dicarboxylate-specific signal transduction histidine kinase
MQEQAQRKNISLIAQTDAAAVTILIDAQRLEQILMSLLARAIRYTLPDRAVLLEVVASAEEGEIRISVRDTGESPANAAAPQELVPFSQMERPFEHLGLELALVAALVEQFGGRMQQDDQQSGNIMLLLPYRPAA